MTAKTRTAGPAPPDPAVRFYRTTLVCIAAVMVALQATAAGPLRDSFWGVHFFAFFPGAVGVMCWGGLVAAGIYFLRPVVGATPVEKVRPPRVGPVTTAVILAAVAAVIFWAFRSQQTILGDGQPLVTDLPGGQRFHPRQPLTMWFQQLLYTQLGGLYAGEGVSGPDVAAHVVAAGSVAAGFLFVIVAFALGRTLTRGTEHGRTASWLVTFLLLTQGYVLLFFGYIENYTYYALLIGLYLLTSLLYLQGRASVQYASLVFALALGVHLSTISLLPSLLFLFGWGLANGHRRIDALKGLGLVMLAIVVVDVVLRSMSPGYSLVSGIKQIVHVARTSQGGGAGLTYTYSLPHVRDFVNEQLLIGPLAALLMAPAAAYAMKRREIRDPAAVFLLLASFVFLVGSWTMSEPLLGYARDWDLFAPAAVSYVVTGLYFLVRHIRQRGPAVRLLGFALAVSLVHTVPWIAINHSEFLSLERFKTLPLGLGRTEVVVGNWYLRHERYDEALEWFHKAIKVNPYNANAYGFLGNIFGHQQNLDMACKAYANAVALRPDKQGFRNNYALTLLQAERYEDALPQLQWLVEKVPNQITYWRSLAEVLRYLGREEEMAEANRHLIELYDRAQAADPTNDTYYIEAGVLLVGLGRDDEGLQMFQRALELNPTSAAGLFNTGLAFLRLGYTDRAEPLFQRFLELYPNHENATWIREQLGTPPAPTE